MTDSGRAPSWAGGYGELWCTQQPTNRPARIALSCIALPIAVFFILVFASEIPRERSEFPGEWTRSLVLCIAGVAVNVGWIVLAMLRSRLSLRPLMLYIVAGFVLNWVLVLLAVGFPYY